jgi:peptide/nickel transport system substrate-binding protein
MRRILGSLLGIVFLSCAALGGDILVVALEAEPTSLDPHQVTDYNSLRATMPMFETLTQFAPGTTEIIPGLAESWETSPDGLTYTFHLRKDVTFHDGTPLTAEAVKFNIERQIDPHHPYHDTGVFAYAEFTFGMVESVTVVDDHTVQIRLKYTFAPFLRNMAMASAAIISPAAIKKYGADIAINPVGTGPFRFKEWVPGVRIVLERNDAYWGEPATLKGLVFRPIVNPQSRLAALEAGEVDFIVNPPPEDVERLRSDPRFKVVAELGQHTWWVALNCQRPPFDSVLVRQAVHYAIDKKAIVEGVLRNTGIVAINPLPPNVWSYTEDVKIYDYNPQLAKQLLAQAGYPNGFTVEFWVPESGSGMQQPVEMATAIQAYLAQVGITAKIQTWEWGTYLDKVFQPDYSQVAEMHEMSWIMDNGDPDDFLYILLSGEQWPPAGFNDAFYKNEKVDRLLAQARRELDQEKRKSLYIEAQKLICEDSPWVWIDHAYEIFVMKAGIQGFVFQPTQGVLRFERVTME